MNYFLLALFLTPPLLAILYAVLEHTGKIDLWLGRKDAIEGFERLKSPAGYPVSWIYNDEQDHRHFVALEKRITKKTTVTKLKKVLDSGSLPSCITVAGKPISINGVPEEWDQSLTSVYTHSHSIVYLFGVARNGGNGKGERACTIGELEKWLADEKDARKYYIGALALGFIAVALILIRFYAVG